MTNSNSDIHLFETGMRVKLAPQFEDDLDAGMQMEGIIDCLDADDIEIPIWLQRLCSVADLDGYHAVIQEIDTVHEEIYVTLDRLTADGIETTFVFTPAELLRL